MLYEKRTEKIKHSTFKPVLPQSSQSVKPGGRQERHAFMLDQHASKGFLPPEPRVYHNHPSLMWLQLKPFLLTVEELICLMQCLYL